LLPSASSAPSVPSLEGLQGLWRRSLLAWKGRADDRTSKVSWLQGPGLYVDLRQQEGMPDFSSLASMHDLSEAEMAWLAGQEAFAGELVFDGGIFEWQRRFDFQPATDAGDRGTLAFENGLLIERGADFPYYEHWHAEETGGGPCWAARLSDPASAARAILVQSGDVFMFARDRTRALYGGTLAEALSAARTPQDRLALLDMEISFGRITAGRWLAGRSTLPLRPGTELAPRLTLLSGQSLLTDEIDLAGRCFTRRWEIEDLRGDVSSFASPETERAVS